MKLQKKFLVIFLCMSVLPVLTSSIYIYRRYTSLSQMQAAQVSENILTISRAKAEELLGMLGAVTAAMYRPGQDHLSVVDDIKRYADETAEVSAGDLYRSGRRLEAMIMSYAYDHPYINGVFLFLPGGQVLGSGMGNGINVRSGYRPQGEEWYERTLARAGGTVVEGPSEKDFFLGSQGPSITFCTALYGTYDRAFLGVLAVDCSWDAFHLSSVNPLPRMAELAILDGDRVICRTDPVIHSQAHLMEDEAPLSLEPLVLRVTIDRELVFDHFGITNATLVFAILGVVLLGILLSFVLSASLTRPIAELSSLMKRHTEVTDISQSRYFYAGNEIGTLYTSYQQMLEEKDAYVKKAFENKLIMLDARMRSLEAQINAHFLYNTLEAMNSIAIIEKVPTLATMSQALGHMFRYSIKTESELVPLSQELCHVGDYVTIQQIRYGDRFRVSVEVPEELMEVRVLKLILQPLVENAFQHGLKACRCGNLIRIRAWQEGDRLLLLVQDNGQGMEEETLAKVREMLSETPDFTELGQRRGERSIGIKNIHSRVRLYYGEPCGLRVESTVGEGTKVYVSVLHH